MDYSNFEELINTMKSTGYDFKKEYAWTLQNVKDRKNGKTFTRKAHISALIYAQLSNQRPWKQIADNTTNIDKIFNDFDFEYLKNCNADELVKKITSLHCGNRQIKKQMEALKDNILQLERIEKEYGSIDNYYNITKPYELIKILSGGKYKIKQMGMALISEYLKGVGVDVIKPDVHVCRILGRIGYTKHCPARLDEAYEVCEDLAKHFNMFNIEIDSILWQYCANGYFELCTNIPHCNKCLVNNCAFKLTVK